MKELYVFDLDNTLTDSRTALTHETAELLKALLAKSRVAVISGATFSQFEKQLLATLKTIGLPGDLLSRLYILPTSGAELFTYDRDWKKQYSEGLSDADRAMVRAAFAHALGTALSKKLLDDRGSQITFSGLGKDAPLDQKAVWDFDQKKRKALVSSVAPSLSDFELRIGGTTSIDVTKKGIDKAFGVERLLAHLKLPVSAAAFVGDALYEGGNDEAVKKAGIETIASKGPEDTRRIIQEFLGVSAGISAGSGAQSAVAKTVDVKSISFSRPPVAFFCAEYALDDETLSYAGGLGVLAGDMLLEYADEGLPFAAIGMWYGPSKSARGADAYATVIAGGKPLVVEVPYEGSAIKAQIKARLFGKSAWLLLLDTDIEENDEATRRILSRIYDTDFYIRMKQDYLLGAGGVRLLSALGITPSVYHLNEGHAAFAAFELVAQAVSKHPDLGLAGAMAKVGAQLVATKHTILAEAGAKVEQADFERFFGSYLRSRGVSADAMFEVGTTPDAKVFSATRFLLKTAKRQNAVSVLHAKFEKEVHPQSVLVPVTNGVHRKRWQAEGFVDRDAQKLSDDEIWKEKKALRRRLVEFTNAKAGSSLDPEVCTVVWARRFVAYKRPELLFSDLERLSRITSGGKPMQFILSGKVYHSDTTGQATLDRIRALANDPQWKGRIAYVPDYSVSVSRELVRGADIWLNTPFRGKEACGTSGMKAGLNGALQMSISDGWIEEADWTGKGWILPEENTASAIYDFLEKEAAPIFYERPIDGAPTEWVKRMRATMEVIEKDFTAKRMIADYAAKLY